MLPSDFFPDLLFFSAADSGRVFLFDVGVFFTFRSVVLIGVQAVEQTKFPFRGKNLAWFSSKSSEGIVDNGEEDRGGDSLGESGMMFRFFFTFQESVVI
jgi:hypothetical protein